MSDSLESREPSESSESADELIHISCDFCGRSQELYAAIEAGWIPGYVKIGDEDSSIENENSCPVCPECTANHLRYEKRDREAYWQIDSPNS